MVIVSVLIDIAKIVNVLGRKLYFYCGWRIYVFRDHFIDIILRQRMFSAIKQDLNSHPRLTVSMF